jgi:hypothetical protein
MKVIEVMKRGILTIFALAFMFFTIGNISAATNCAVGVSIVNQEPYPATPGEYVEVVFQITGVQYTNCPDITFELKEKFPFSLDPGVQNTITIKSGTFTSDYADVYILPYKIRVDENALDGISKLSIAYERGDLAVHEDFEINIEDSLADFEIFVKDYNAGTRELTFEILNIADVDVEALTLEIPKQENVEVKGANRIVVGDLDSNEYTTADFEAILSKETDINVTIIYTDLTNVRRTISKTVHFDPFYFSGLARDQKAQPIWLYIVIVLAIAAYIWYRVKKHKKKKKLKEKQLSKK